MPSEKLLNNYAQVLINFALGSGAGVKPKEVVYIQYDSPALPLALAVYRQVLLAGGNPIVKSIDEEFAKVFYSQASNTQLDFFPEKYTRALVDTIDHRVYLIAPKDPFYLKGIDAQKIMRANAKNKLYRQWLDAKEDAGKLTWTLALYGTEKQAKEANLSLKSYWGQITKACFLDEVDPLEKWREVFKEVQVMQKRLNALPIEKLHVTAKNTDLWIGMGEKRKWMGGSGRNIPSFEIFTSPDWRGTQGHIAFDLPLYRYGNLIEGVYLEFKNGQVVKAKATKNEKLLKELVKQKNADKIGEYSLTDVRFSRINKFMANTLFDENFGGKYGNTHLALGKSYHDCYAGDAKKLTEADWAKLGYNDSPEHTDIIAKSDRKVMATLKNGKEILLYEKGSFAF